VGRRIPIKLAEISLTVSKGDAGALGGKLGVLYELPWNGKDYVGYGREYTLPER
jgi:hypothetical protein